MSLSEMRAKVKASIWQAVAQSGVALSGIPQAEIDRLVGAITDGVLKEMDDFLSQATGQPAAVSKGSVDEGDNEAETILWEGRPFLSLSVHYQITSERVRITEGMLGKDREDIELVRIQDIDVSQGISERMLGIGDLHIRSHDPSHPSADLNNVSNPTEVHEILRRAVLKARKKYNVSFREQM
ncbi:MAG: PH domain-containing protein [Anaerolineae bacterium]|nr:PH domain-containing protein [Anaerolineae bacterium]